MELNPSSSRVIKELGKEKTPTYVQNNKLTVFTILFIILYANDTIILSDDAKAFQDIPLKFLYKIIINGS